MCSFHSSMRSSRGVLDVQIEPKNIFTKKTRTLIFGLIIIGIYSTSRFFIGQLMFVETDELNPVLQRGDLVWINYHMEAKLGDIVLLKTMKKNLNTSSNRESSLEESFIFKDQLALRRVVGVPPHEYEVRRGRLWLNGLPAPTSPSKTSLVTSLESNSSPNTLTSNNSNSEDLIQWREWLNKELVIDVIGPKWSTAKGLSIPSEKLSEQELYVLCDQRVQCLFEGMQEQTQELSVGRVSRSIIFGVVQYKLRI